MNGVGKACSPVLDVINVSDIVITTAFLIEMVLRCVALGFAFGAHAYLRSGWNRLDFAIILVSVLSLGMGGSKSLASLRSLRVRPPFAKG